MSVRTRRLGVAAGLAVAGALAVAAFGAAGTVLAGAHHAEQGVGWHNMATPSPGATEGSKVWPVPGTGDPVPDPTVRTEVMSPYGSVPASTEWDGPPGAGTDVIDPPPTAGDPAPFTAAGDGDLFLYPTAGGADPDRGFIPGTSYGATPDRGFIPGASDGATPDDGATPVDGYFPTHPVAHARPGIGTEVMDPQPQADVPAAFTADRDPGDLFLYPTAQP